MKKMIPTRWNDEIGPYETNPDPTRGCKIKSATRLHGPYEMKKIMQNLICNKIGPYKSAKFDLLRDRAVWNDEDLIYYEIGPCKKTGESVWKRFLVEVWSWICRRWDLARRRSSKRTRLDLSIWDLSETRRERDRRMQRDWRDKSRDGRRDWTSISEFCCHICNSWLPFKPLPLWGKVDFLVLENILIIHLLRKLCQSLDGSSSQEISHHRKINIE